MSPADTVSFVYFNIELQERLYAFVSIVTEYRRWPLTQSPGMAAKVCCDLFFRDK